MKIIDILFELEPIVIHYLSSLIDLSNVEFLSLNRHRVPVVDFDHNPDDDDSCELADKKYSRMHAYKQDTRSGSKSLSVVFFHGERREFVTVW